MHPIKRGILVVLLSLGAIGGFTHGFARMAACHGGCAAATPPRDEFEDHVADVCTRAAHRAYEEDQARDAQDHHHHHHGGWGGPQWGGPPPSWGGPSWGPPPQPWGPPAAPAAIPAAPDAPVAPAAPAE